ncbi:restriction endonuclease [Streptomyces sp. RKAG293]|uniref:restriction endonuclease n=1 Tax=Streptomyces sp. RKAG293 TaxID=2893403 RepID=UPI002033AFF5|nr:restriction endonuclease [Streptomyces sp. RKAG293]MCM2417660.1 restriction endonuclease [Streptomyces sp. RKAG293]
MAKAGRALEELVATLETLLSDSLVEIKSPDRIRGKTGGGLREVDVSLRTRVGSANILVIMECRDRSDPQTVEWIDAIAGKQEEVGANKAVAVSRSGFTSHARAQAQAKGIELRTIGEVDRASVWDWLGVAVVTARVNNLMEMKSAQIIIPDSVSTEANSEALSIVSGAASDALILVKTSDGTPASVLDVWRAAPQSDLLSSLRPGETKRGTVHLLPSDPGQWFAIPITDDTVPITEVVIVADFRVDERNVPIARFEYLGDDGPLIEGASAEFSHEGSTVKMVIHSAPDGSMFLVVEQPDGADLSFEANLVLGVIDNDEDSTPAEQ